MSSEILQRELMINQCLSRIYHMFKTKIDPIWEEGLRVIRDFHIT